MESMKELTPVRYEEVTYKIPIYRCPFCGTEARKPNGIYLHIRNNHPGADTVNGAAPAPPPVEEEDGSTAVNALTEKVVYESSQCKITMKEEQKCLK